MWGARWPATALDKQILSEVVRSFGEMAGLNGNRPWFEPDWPLSLNRIATGNVLQRQRLTFRPGRTGETVQKVSGAGATPPKTALACANGHFGEVAPGTLPCRKAYGNGGCAEVSVRGRSPTLAVSMSRAGSHYIH